MYKKAVKSNDDKNYVNFGRSSTDSGKPLLLKPYEYYILKKRRYFWRILVSLRDVYIILFTSINETESNIGASCDTIHYVNSLLMNEQKVLYTSQES